MPQALGRPNPPHDYAERASHPLVSGDADVVAVAVERILGTAPEMTPRQKRATEMLCLPLDNVPSWVRHHAGEAWSAFSSFAARGGIDYCPKSDDLDEVCELFVKMPECWLDRLEPCFVGLEREADPDGFFRQWYHAIMRRYIKSLSAAQSASFADSKHRHLLCERAVTESVPSFSQFFDSLRCFLGLSVCRDGRWREGDEARSQWHADII